MNQELATEVNQNIIKKKFWTKKKIIWTTLIVLVVAFVAYRINASKNNSSNIQTDTVKKQDLKATVLATGQVVSSINLNLSFKVTGVVEKVNVVEGSTVKQGDILATLDQSTQAANVTSARGSLAQAQANYDKVVAGASSQAVAVAQVNLDNAKSQLATAKQQQAVLVNNAYSALLNSGVAAIAATGNTDSAVATISGSYTGADQGSYQISLYATGSGEHFNYNGLESGAGIVSTNPTPLGTRGLYIQFSSAMVGVGDTWNVNIPNTQASSYVANYNAYQAALQTQAAQLSSAQSAVDTAQANLNLQTAQAQPADLAAAQAAILSAQGQVQAAEAGLENTILRAPANGTITSVDTKVGEQASALAEVMVLQDVGDLHVEADVSEANIAQVQPGQTVDFTFDALGPDRHFSGTVQTVDPGATVISGVVDYKVTASVENISDIKPGMTANMTVLVAQKSNVLAVSQQAIISQNNNSYVRVVDDPKKKTYHQVQVQTGLQADGGLVEITSGLSEGQEIVTYIKN